MTRSVLEFNGGSRLAAMIACSVLALAGILQSAPALATNILLAKSGGVAAESRTIERGRYLVAIAGCNDCHTAGFLQSGGRTPEKDRLTGSNLGWRGSWGTAYPANLRRFVQTLTEQQWIAFAKERQPGTAMPYVALNAMSANDARALYHYLRWLGPAGELAAKAVPPDREPPQPYVMFPAQ